MKHFIFVFVFSLFFIVNVHAEKTITVKLTDDEYKAMSVLSVSPEQWVQDAVKNKIYSIKEKLVQENSNLQPSKMSESDKKSIIDNLDIEKERKKRHEK